ncbi:glycosyltransferase family 39 protein [Pontibacter sp. BT310]|uniref:Glycosyltransferase family 39 protein n=1 Tax=Pontibacter populi TaxID=890055 RepID=A0ABS6X872_9BACT|nr:MULTISPECIES: glycosyltransferase family 39 protein [Pontibacter]MBJ6117259.1 glycosyltransferase family 39 protein [Pontibacter sp. BT310]MBR0569684.1 glycosyltransferase family 39 protein [Microvirga sp. STS03]MBW3364112.1 glycosyltransferase family 39 protein [Pontibacter populi]
MATEQLRNTLILAGFVVLKFVLQYVLVDGAYDLHRDEFLHLDQANHLAAGYISVPPFTAFIAWVIQQLDNSYFWVRFFPALFGALTIVVTWGIVDELKGGLYAKILGATALLFSVLLRINILFQPNSFDILCWALTFYLFIRFLHTQQAKWLYWLGAVIGFGFLNKYTILFLVAGLATALLLSLYRKLFLQRELYIAGLIALVIASPNIAWQLQHNFPVVAHMQELKATQLNNVNPADFLLDQVLFFIGSIFLVLGALTAFIVYRPFKPYRFIGICFIVVMALFLALKAKSYYTIGLYPVLIAFGSVYWEQLFGRGWLRYTRPLWPLVTIALFVPIINVVFPVLSPAEIQVKAEKFKDLNLLKWEDGKDHLLPQDFADMQSWQELTQIASKAYNLIPASEKQQTLILCDNYGQAGAINYYSRKTLPQAVSYNADYIYWFPDLPTIKQIILVKGQGEAPLQESEKQYFGSVQKIGSITNRYAREQGTTVYLLSDIAPFVRQYLYRRLAVKQSKLFQSAD